jgi:hypothetical protein
MKRTTIFWTVISGGLYTTDPKATLTIGEYGKKNRVYSSPTNSSLQRIIRLSKYYRVDIDDGRIEVTGGIKRK